MRLKQVEVTELPNDTVLLRETVRLLVLVIAVYGYLAIVPALVSQTSWSIPTKVSIYRILDYFPAVAMFLGAFLSTLLPQRGRHLWLLATPLCFIFAMNLRGPWIIPGTFDWNQDPIQKFHQIAFVSVIAGLILGATTRKLAKLQTRSFKEQGLLIYIFLALSIFGVVLGELMTPLKSLIPLQLHLGLAAAGSSLALLDAFAERLTGEK